MHSPMITVEVRPGFILRIRQDEADRHGYKALVPAQNKAIKPKQNKRKPKTTEEENDAPGDDE